jgi:hypothetical protein
VDNFFLENSDYYYWGSWEVDTVVAYRAEDALAACNRSFAVRDCRVAAVAGSAAACSQGKQDTAAANIALKLIIVITTVTTVVNTLIGLVGPCRLPKHWESDIEGGIVIVIMASYTVIMVAGSRHILRRGEGAEAIIRVRRGPLEKSHYDYYGVKVFGIKSYISRAYDQTFMEIALKCRVILVNYIIIIFKGKFS